jgi:hypothetical protein
MGELRKASSRSKDPHALRGGLNASQALASTANAIDSIVHLTNNRFNKLV